jgi:hypothetical protein
VQPRRRMSVPSATLDVPSACLPACLPVHALARASSDNPICVRLATSTAGLRISFHSRFSADLDMLPIVTERTRAGSREFLGGYHTLGPDLASPYSRERQHGCMHAEFSCQRLGNPVAAAAMRQPFAVLYCARRQQQAKTRRRPTGPPYFLMRPPCIFSCSYPTIAKPTCQKNSMHPHRARARYAQNQLAEETRWSLPTFSRNHQSYLLFQPSTKIERF